MEKKRNSSLELLRIICMLLIIAHHYSVHGGYEVLTYNTLTTGSIFIQILSLFGKISCLIFALISGFFLINCPNKNKHYERIIRLILEMFIYSILIWLIIHIFKPSAISLGDTFRSFLPIFHDNYWYIIYYIMLCILVPIINPIILKLERKDFLKLIVTLLIIWSVIPTFFNLWKFSNLDCLLIMYFIGAYIKLHIYQKVTYKNKINLIIGLFSALLLIVLTLTFDLLGYVTENNYFIYKVTDLYKINSILSVSCAIFIFMYFSNLNFSNKIINNIASSTLGIYLIHDNELLRPYIWTVISPNINYLSFPYIHAIIKIILVFIFSLLIDLLRRKIIGRKFEDWFINKCRKITNKMSKKISEINAIHKYIKE